MASARAYQSASCPTAGSDEWCTGHNQFVRKNSLKGGNKETLLKRISKSLPSAGIFFVDLAFC